MRRQSRAPEPHDDPEGTLLVEASRVEVQRWTAVQRRYPQHLETIALPLHPFNIDKATAQTSAQVAHRLHTEGEALDALATRHQFSACHAARSEVRKPWPALAALVAFWWAGVEQDWEHAALSPPWQVWAKTSRLPRV